MLENGDEEHGTSVHFVTDELDGGPVILQAKVPVFDGDNEDDMTERVQTQEHAIYPLVVSWFVDGRLEMQATAQPGCERSCPRRVMRPKSSLFELPGGASLARAYGPVGRGKRSATDIPSPTL